MNPQMILSGDDNFEISGTPVKSGILGTFIEPISSLGLPHDINLLATSVSLTAVSGNCVVVDWVKARFGAKMKFGLRLTPPIASRFHR